jgi:hypothetical protein
MRGRSIQWGLLAALCGMGSVSSAGKEAAKHSSVAVIQKVEKGSNEVALRFAVSAGKGVHLNLDAPWSLQLDEVKGITLARSKFDKKDFDEKSGQFAVKVTKSAKQGELRYKLVAFTCTADKKQCYREVHKGGVVVGK